MSIYSSTSDTQELYLAKDQPLGSDFITPWHEITYHDMGAIQMWWSGADTIDGSLSLQMSLDKEHWIDYFASTNRATVCAPSGSTGYDLTHLTYRYWRIAYTANTNTTGTITILSFIKRRR